MKTKTIEFDRVNSDSNGNPRYACHFLNLITEQDRERVKVMNDKRPFSYELDLLYAIALKRAKQLGGRKFHNKQYGGGIVFQSYNIKNTEQAIKEIVSNVQYVKFLIEKDSKDEVFAYFPYDDEGNGRKGCYAHIGQHSVCSPEYANECKPAKKKQYAELKNELEQRGYQLQII